MPDLPPPMTPPCVLALHGFTGRGSDFAVLQPWVPATLVAPDLVGHGPGPWPEDDAPWTLAGEARRIAELASGHQAVLGYSMGGRLALQLAIDHPRCLSALILIGATAGIQNAESRAIRAEADAQRAVHLSQVGVPRFLETWAQHPVIRSQRSIPPDVRKTLRSARIESTAAGLARSLIGMGTGAMDDLWNHLPQLTLPVLLITGELDEKFSRVAREMAALMPQARHVRVRGAGHCTHLERPQETGAIIGQFLSALPAPEG